MTQDREYYQKIGKMGREAMIKQYGPNAMVQAGYLGGTRTFVKRGREYMRQLGRRGAETTMRRYGHEHMKRIAVRGGARVQELVGKGKQYEIKFGR